MLVSRPLRVVRQPPCAHSFRTGLTECDWHPTLSFRIPAALPTGVYIAKLSVARGERDCLFVVRSTVPQPLLAQLPTATYEAYNGWGGDSLYPGGADRVAITRTTQGVKVSYDRPYDSVTGAGQFFARDVAMVWFLERYRYPVSYTTSESVDVDPGQLAGHRGAARLRTLRVLVRAPAPGVRARERPWHQPPVPELGHDGLEGPLRARRRGRPARPAAPGRRSSPTRSSRRATRTAPSGPDGSPTAARR